MESKIYVSNQNGDNRQLTFTPEVRKITRLGDMKGTKIVKSPSWPTTPTTPRSQLKRDEVKPVYWTLGRKGLGNKVSDEEFRHESSCFGDTPDDAFKEINSILSSMDLAKYYLRGPKESSNNTINNNMHHPLRRSLSVQPETVHSSTTTKKSFLGSIPPPPKTKSIFEVSPDTATKDNRKFARERIYSLDLCPVKDSRNQVNSKLKELTERLRPSSAPPSPHRKPKYAVPRSAPPTSSFSFWMDPLPDENSLHLRTTSAGNSLKEFEISIDDPSIKKLTKPSKLPRKHNIASTGYATLPRRKPSEAHDEPRTLASLDLNINIDSYRIYQNSSVSNEILPTKHYLNRENIEQHNQKDISKSEMGIIENENIFQSKNVSEEEVDTCSNNSSRRGSIKSNSSSSRKADFDLNFSKYGSLTSSRGDRRKSISKKDHNSLENVNRPHLKKSTSETVSKPKENKKSETIIFEGNLKANKYNGTIQIQETEFANSTNNVDEIKSVPALPTSFSNPLEEEIRTIAKLLDGKESLFLKLIQSSKFESERNNSISSMEIDSCRNDEASKCFEETEMCPKPTEAFRKTSEFSPVERSSPTRLRAMTVPGTEPNRNSIATQKSPPPQQKRFYKKRLRGPYGEMLEQEMSKSFNKPRPSYAKDLDFLKDLETAHSNATSNSTTQSTRQRPLLRSSSHSLDETHTITVESSPKRKTSANIPLVTSNEQESLCVPPSSVSGTVSEPTLHIRSHSDSVKTSSVWNVDCLISNVLKQTAQQDTRTHIVQELYDTEVSYVDSLQIIIKKYMVPLKSSEHSAEIEGSQVDQIFCQVPEILKFHETFLETLRSRVSYWDTKQKIGDVFIDVFTQSAVVETYIEFINNWKDARDAIKAISLAKPAFAKFLELTSREHKGKLTLDALLIMPVQRIPRYELLIKELLKHSPMDHPDYKLLLQAQKEVHDLAVKINKVEREALLQEQRMQKLREVEQLIEGVVDLTQGDRSFIRHDFVLMPGGLGMKKERCIFLFSDMLLITSVKKKGAIRKSSLAVAGSTCGSLESNKYKLLLKTSLHNVDMMKTEDDEPCARTFLKEVTYLESDIATLKKIIEIVGTIIYEHQLLEDTLKELLTTITKHLAEKQASCSHLMSLELAVNINDEVENMMLVFPNPEQRMMWQAAFLDAKDKLDNVCEKNTQPEFLCFLPLRKTRAGLQITCAAAVVDTCQSGLPDLWICSSDGFVGQVCVLTFQNEPVIASSVNICNARILCIAAVPGVSSGSLLVRRRSTLLPYLPGFKFAKLGKGENELGRTRSFPLDSDSDDDYIDAAEEEFASDDANTLQPTMWLGTEDGCIYVFNCTDMRLQRPKLRMQHSTCIYDIVHIDERVFVSLANGEIIIYSRDHNGLWNTSSPQRIQIATNVAPISKMILVEDKLWCSTLNSIAIINTASLELEHTFQVASELMRHITCIVVCGQGVWVTIQSSPVIHLYHASSYDHLLEINITSHVTKILSGMGCLEIIRGHKLACLRVSSICVEKNLLWIGTSAGVILNFEVPHITSLTTTVEFVPNIMGMGHGHFGHVRFLTSIYASSGTNSSTPEGLNRSLDPSLPSSSKEESSSSAPYSALVIAGGDGFEDFGNLVVDAAGRDDSTNHLLMWRV